MKITIKKLGLCLGAVVMLAASLTGAAKAEEVIKFSAYFSPEGFTHKGIFAPLLREIEEESNGEIKFEIYSSGALGKMTQQYDLLKNGLADMSLYIPAYSGGRFPLSEAATLPFAFTSVSQGTLVLNELIEKWLAPEHKNVKLLFMHTPPPAGVISAEKTVAKVGDFEGMKMRSVGAVGTDILKVLGANVLTVPLPEVYTALERGVVDASIMDPVSSVSYKLHEPITKYTPLAFSSVATATAMNQRRWDSLSPEHQAIITGAIKRSLPRLIENYNEENRRSLEIMKESGVEIIEFPAEERERIIEKVLPLWAEWVEEKESEGDPAKAFMVDFEAARKKYADKP